jgi:hypothetical protein
MKPFDLEAAKRGEPIVTRDGRPAKFIAHVPEANACYQVVALFSGLISTHAVSGRVYPEKHPNDADLFMAPRKRTVWVNVYPPEARKFGGAYETEAIANNYAGHERIGNRAWPLEIED